MNMEKEIDDRRIAGMPVRRSDAGAAGGGFRLHRKGGVVYATAPLLDGLSGIVHGYSTRLGGVSEGEIGSMNLSFARDDLRENVLENYRRIGEAVGFDPARVVLPYQTHSTRVRVVTESDAGRGYSRERGYTDVDALVTDVPGITLACFGSDCVMLLAADPVRRVVGCAHSGWRGTVGDIGGELIRTMAARFGCDPASIRTAVGPSICQSCYEVSEDVIEQFARRYPARVHHRLFYRKENGKYQLSLWEACRENFRQAGVKEEHICVTDLCTCCNPGLLFSHRVQKGKQTNQAGLICLS